MGMKVVTTDCKRNKFWEEQDVKMQEIPCMEAVTIHPGKKIRGEIEASGGSGNGIGLKNVQDRIKIQFGDKYGLKIHSKEGCFTKVSVLLPYKGK